MPVFDFSNASTEKTEDSVCTYTTFASDENTTSPEQPILVLANSVRQWKHHSCGVFFQSGEKEPPLSSRRRTASERGHPESGRPFRELDPVAG